MRKCYGFPQSDMFGGVLVIGAVTAFLPGIFYGDRIYPYANFSIVLGQNFGEQKSLRGKKARGLGLFHISDACNILNTLFPCCKNSWGECRNQHLSTLCSIAHIFVITRTGN